MTTRRAIIIGGGGVLGGAWALGALRAWEIETGCATSDADVVVGTSAGALLLSLVSQGVSTQSLCEHYIGQPVTHGPLAGYVFDPDAVAGPDRPPLPSILTPGSWSLLGEAVRHPGRLSATTVLAGLLPPGSRSLARMGHLVEGVSSDGRWPSVPQLWVCATDYSRGERVVFGRPGAPVASVAEAVMASCAIPGWFAPIHISGRDYVDGGAVSATSVDVVEHLDIDEVVVITPMGARVPLPVDDDIDSSASVLSRVEHKWREHITHVAQSEAARLESRGMRVIELSPGPQDLAVMGLNVMDRAKRQRMLETSLETSARAWRHLMSLAPPL